ncbi:polymer-forming cytoskeletal protein [Streptomyces roseirectus]|uniref:Polymer-forming cytoskeletal protein n=1 Tax=Streptomyces roseirectus TaxID=2768066 RepID=A0A7H0IPY8_9ACTN|nr:polymer-forming cytoskeletal protein [Streptomyces roseirectus]QNP74854.1 polymer-forming cytoskeletal protein [Streptomyces roseirectus]
MSDQPLLTYRIATSPAPLQAGTSGTNSQGRITITVTKGAEDTYCDWIQIAVPGDAKSGGAYFTGDPKPVFSSDGDWSTGSLVQVSAQHLGLAGDALYYRAIFHNQGDDSEPFDGTLHLGISGELVDSTGTLDLHITEHSDTSSDPDDFTPHRRTVPLTVTEPVFYLNAFLARDDDSATVPKTKFSSSATPYLSWESNGSRYRLFDGESDKPVYEGPNTFCTLPPGSLAMDTTFTLEASMSPEDVGSGFSTIHQYAVLTLTVKDPTLDALTVEGGISGRSALEISGDASVGNSLTVGTSAEVGRGLTVGGDISALASLTVDGSLTAESGLYSGGSAQINGDLTVDSTLNANGQVNAVSDSHYVRIRELRGPYGVQLSINSNTELIERCDLNVTGDIKIKNYGVLSDQDTIGLNNTHYGGYLYASTYEHDGDRRIPYVWVPGDRVVESHWRITRD